MTCIAAVRDGSTVHIAADSQASNPSICGRLRGRKIISRAGMVLGVCGKLRLFDILDACLAESVRPPRRALDRWMRSAFMNAVREAAKQAGHMKVDNSVESIDGQVLVAARGRVFVVEQNLQIVEWGEKYCAIGSGAEVALGSLHASRQLNWSPKERVVEAVRAACTHTPWCGPPIHTASLERSEW